MNFWWNIAQTGEIGTILTQLIRFKSIIPLDQYVVLPIIEDPKLNVMAFVDMRLLCHWNSQSRKYNKCTVKHFSPFLSAIFRQCYLFLSHVSCICFQFTLVTHTQSSFNYKQKNPKKERCLLKKKSAAKQTKK